MKRTQSRRHAELPFLAAFTGTTRLAFTRRAARLPTTCLLLLAAVVAAARLGVLTLLAAVATARLRALWTAARAGLRVALLRGGTAPTGAAAVFGFTTRRALVVLTALARATKTARTALLGPGQARCPEDEARVFGVQAAEAVLGRGAVLVLLPTARVAAHVLRRPTPRAAGGITAALRLEAAPVAVLDAHVVAGCSRPRRTSSALDRTTSGTWASAGIGRTRWDGHRPNPAGARPAPRLPRARRRARELLANAAWVSPTSGPARRAARSFSDHGDERPHRQGRNLARKAPVGFRRNAPSVIGKSGTGGSCHVHAAVPPERDSRLPVEQAAAEQGGIEHPFSGFVEADEEDVALVRGRPVERVLRCRELGIPGRAGDPRVPRRIDRHAHRVVARVETGRVDETRPVAAELQTNAPERKKCLRRGAKRCTWSGSRSWSSRSRSGRRLPGGRLRCRSHRRARRRRGTWSRRAWSPKRGALRRRSSAGSLAGVPAWEHGIHRRSRPPRSGSRRDRLPRDVRGADSVHGDRVASVVAPAAEERGIHEPASGWIELHDEGDAFPEPLRNPAGSPGSRASRLPRRGRRFRPSRRRCHAPSRCRPAEQRRVDEARPVSLELRHEEVGLSFQGSVGPPGRGRDPRLRPARDVDVPRRRRRRACAVVGRAPEVRAPDQLSPRIELRHEHVGREARDAGVSRDDVRQLPTVTNR